MSKPKPLPFADTLEVRERLPPGAAAVLINRNHSYTDLFLPVDSRQLEWVSQVDGTRTLAQIAPRRGDREAARELFRRLWDYDQVVFDTSGAGG